MSLVYDSKTNTFKKPATSDCACAITVGNEKSSSFESDVKFTLWDEDTVSFAMRGVQGTAQEISNTVVLDVTGGQQKWVLDGNLLRWKMSLYFKPSSNQYQFELNGNWNDFNYFVQDDVWPGHTTFIGDKETTYARIGDEWQEWTDSNGEVHQRPRVVAGSIAVYHKSNEPE